MAGIYHDRQHLQFCALHALNNLLQRPLFTKRDLDRISDDLRRVSLEFQGSRWAKIRGMLAPHPHRAPWGTGRWDVNVITAALESQGMSLIWADQRKPVSVSLERLNDPTLIGLIAHGRGEHWIAVRWFPVPGEQGREWWDLDSKLERPGYIGGSERCVSWTLGKGQVLFVRLDRQVDDAAGRS